MCAEVSSSVPHFLQAGSMLSPITCRCLLRVLCPVSRPIRALVCVLLKDSNRAPVARLGPEINSRACLCALQGPRHNAKCWFFSQRFNFYLIFCLETPIKASGPINRWPEPLLASLSAVSFPLTSAWPGTQYSPTACRSEISFNACWHWRTKETSWRLEALSEPPDYQSRYWRISLTYPGLQFHERRLGLRAYQHPCNSERFQHLPLMEG
jgi:hypothetical protein